MALVVKDRVKQTTTTTGTGNIVLNGNVDGFQTFAAALADGDTTYFGIFVPSTNDYEVGLGTWTEGSATLARTTVLESSNSGSAINITAQAEVFITQPAEKAVFQDANGDVDLGSNKILFGNVYSGTNDLPSASTYHGMFAHVHGTGKAYYAHGGNWIELVNEDTSGNVSMGGNLTVTGDLTVNGTTTTVNTTNTVVTDTLIELGNGTSGSPSNDAGIVIERGSSDNAFIGYDESADKFTVGTGSFTGATTGNLTISTGTLVANVEGNVTGNVTGNTSGSSGSTTGNAVTATALATARNIGGVSFDGTAAINLPGVNTSGNQDTSGNAATATTAGTVTTAAQSNITSLGTLTTLTVDNINVNGNTISSTDTNGHVVITPNGTGNLNVNTDTLAISAAENESAALVLNADEADDNADTWRIASNTGNTLSIENQISGSSVNHVTLTPNSTVANSTAAFAGNITVANTIGVGNTVLTGASLTESGDFTIDVGANISLDADGGNIIFKDGGTQIGAITVSSTDVVLQSTVQDRDLIFKGNDGGATTTLLTLDVSDAGSAYFNNNLYIPSRIYHTGNTSAYLEFHNTNEFRIVTGDHEMLEVNDTTVQFGAAANLNGNNLTNVEDMYIRDKIYHDGDTDTYFAFDTNEINIYSGGTHHARFNTSDFITYSALKEDYDALSGTTPTIDVDAGGGFSLTTSGNTTFTFSSCTSGVAVGFVLQVTAGGSHTLTWPNTVDWAGGTAPDAPASGASNLYVFYTRDGGSNWIGVLSAAAYA